MRLPLLSLMIAPVMARHTGLGNLDDMSNLTDKYIVSLKSGISLADHLASIETIMTGHENADYGGVSHRYRIGGFRGYAGHFSTSAVSYIRSHPHVSMVEADQHFTAQSTFSPEALTEQPHAALHLFQISHRSPGSPHQAGPYVYDSSAGAGTYVYVLDTGIDVRNPEFEDRALFGYNALSSESCIPNNKCADTNGHGTHVAGVIGGRTYGVAKRTKLIAVKVSKTVDGDMSILLEGIDWAVKDIKRTGRMAQAVINVSLGGAYSATVNNAVNAAYQAGVTTVACAGNEDADARQALSPGSAPGAITVAATNFQRQRTVWSNYGFSVTLFAPGFEVLGPKIGQGFAKASGTSQASAVVAGLVAYFKGMHHLPNAVATKEFVISKALKGLVGHPKGSANLFANNGSGR